MVSVLIRLVFNNCELADVAEEVVFRFLGNVLGLLDSKVAFDIVL